MQKKHVDNYHQFCFINRLIMNESNIQIPIFPLKSVILLPGSFLPLNIFEKRYLNMIDDSLKTNLRLIGMVQPFIDNQESISSYNGIIGCYGKIVKFESLREMIVEVSPKPEKRPKIAVFSGTKFATSTLLCDRILKTLEDKRWDNLPDYLCRWLEQQESYSKLPEPKSLLIETFPRNNLHYTCVYGFAGRNAQQTLGLLLTKRMEELNLNPLGFVANDYTTLVWGLTKVLKPKKLLEGENILRGLDLWLSNNAVMKRTFRSVATVAGLIERNLPGLKKSGRQATFSSDILYDTLLRYDPNHLLLTATKNEAMQGLVDFGRIKNMLEKTKNRIDHIDLKRVSPFSAPLLLEAGRIPIHGSAIELMLDTEINSLIADAGLDY